MNERLSCKTVGPGKSGPAFNRAVMESPSRKVRTI